MTAKVAKIAKPERNVGPRPAESDHFPPQTGPASKKFNWAVGVDMNFENFWATYFVMDQAKKGK